MRRIQAGYLGLIAHLDHEIGRLLDGLEASGFAGDTRVLYTSDHGDLAGQNGLFGKCCLYEGSIGVPLIMAGPGIPEGRRCARGRSAMSISSRPSSRPWAPDLVGEDADLPGRSLWPALRCEPWTIRAGLCRVSRGGFEGGQLHAARCAT